MDYNVQVQGIPEDKCLKRILVRSKLENLYRGCYDKQGRWLKGKSVVKLREDLKGNDVSEETSEYLS